MSSISIVNGDLLDMEPVDTFKQVEAVEVPVVNVVNKPQQQKTPLKSCLRRTGDLLTGEKAVSFNETVQTRDCDGSDMVTHHSEAPTPAWQEWRKAKAASRRSKSEKRKANGNVRACVSRKCTDPGQMNKDGVRHHSLRNHYDVTRQKIDKIIDAKLSRIVVGSCVIGSVALRADLEKLRDSTKEDLKGRLLQYGVLTPFYHARRERQDCVIDATMDQDWTEVHARAPVKLDSCLRVSQFESMDKLLADLERKADQRVQRQFGSRNARL